MTALEIIRLRDINRKPTNNHIDRMQMVINMAHKYFTSDYTSQIDFEFLLSELKEVSNMKIDK